MINSIIYFYNENYNNEKEFDAFNGDLNATKLGLIPNEEYSQIIDLGTEIEEDLRSIQEIGLMVNKKVYDNSHIKYNEEFSSNGRYLFLYFYINQDYKDDCLQIRVKINNEVFYSNIFTCNSYNSKFSSLITYRHKENLYGTPYTEFENLFQQIRIPAYYQRRTTNADAENSYYPGIIPVDNVSRIERTFKQVYTIIATDLLNKTISCALDSDFVYLENYRVIADPYVPEEIEEGGWFSKSVMSVQVLDEKFSGLINYPYNLKFDYKVDSNNVDLSNCISGNIFYINWGDGVENKEISHTYDLLGIYTIKVKTENTDSLFFQFKNVIKFDLIPEGVDKIDCTGCMLTLKSIYNLFLLMNSNNPTDAIITNYDNDKTVFSKYILVGNQQNPILLDNETISEATKLISKYWFIDYSYIRDWNSSANSSRYIDENNNLKLYPQQHTIRFTTKGYVFSSDIFSVKLSAYKRSGIDWNLYDWDCFVYSRLDKYVNNSWQPMQKAPYLTKADAEVSFELSNLSKGFHKFRVVQQDAPKLIDGVAHYEYIRTVESTIPSIDSNDTMAGITGGWSSNFNKNTNEGTFFGMYFSRITYHGVGEVIPNIRFEGYFKDSTNSYIDILKSKYVIKITEAGTYKFVFDNYTVDFSLLSDGFDWLAFRFVYVINDNIYESNQIMWSNKKVIVNKEITIDNLPVGAIIAPLIIGQSKSGVSKISGDISVVGPSLLLISKL